MIVFVNVNNPRPNNRTVDVLTFNKNAMKINMNNSPITYWLIRNSCKTNTVKWKGSMSTKSTTSNNKQSKNLKGS